MEKNVSPTIHLSRLSSNNSMTINENINDNQKPLQPNTYFDMDLKKLNLFDNVIIKYI